MAPSKQRTLAASLLPSDVWPKSSELTSESTKTVSLTDVIGDFASVTEAVLLVATCKKKFTVGDEERGYWYGVYYCPEWKENKGVKRINLTFATKDYLTTEKGAVPFFCTYKELQTKKKKTFFKMDAQAIDKKDEAFMAKLRECVPESVWKIYERDHVEFDPEED